MKKSVTLLILLYFAVSDNTFAQKDDDSLNEYFRKEWNRLMPVQVKLQFAGSMGMFSAGPGWLYGKKKHWQTDLFLGYIPPLSGTESHVTVTLKETYSLSPVPINKRFSLEPLTGGIYINKIFGEYFWSHLPERYPRNYYFWAVNTRFHIFLGQSVVFVKDKSEKKELAFFYEFNTNDLYVISAIGNKTIGLKDIIGLSFGIRYRRL